MMWFDLSTFLLYLAVTVALLFWLGGFGYLLVRSWLPRVHPAWTISASVFSGILMIVFLLNVFSYLFPFTRVAQGVGLGTAIISAIVLLRSHNAWRPFLTKRSSGILLISLFLLYIVFFTNGLYDVYNFDEEFHRPLISSILRDIFPLVNFDDPFSQSFHYNYHYGLDLFAAMLVVMTRLSPSVVLDLLSSVALISTFFLLYSFTHLFSPQTSRKILITILTLLVGGLVLYAASPEQRSAFSGGSPFPFLYGSFASLFHALYAITFLYIPLAYFFVLIFALSEFSSQKTRQKWITGVILTILLASYALIGESEYVLFFVLLAGLIAIRKKIFRESYRNQWQTSLCIFLPAFLFSLFISFLQGGVLTGIVRQALFGQSAYGSAPTGTPPAIDLTPIIQKTSPPLLSFNLDKHINKIFLPENITLLLSELGVFLIALPILGYAIWRMMKKIQDDKIHTREFIVIFFLLMVLNFLLPVFFSTRIVGDEYLSKFFITGIPIFFFLLLIFLIAQPSAFRWTRTFFLAILLLSATSNFFLKAHMMTLSEKGFAFHLHDPDQLGKIDQQAMRVLSQQQPKGVLTVLSSANERFFLSDVAGASFPTTAMSGLLGTRTRLYLQPQDVRDLGFSYIYASPSLEKELGPYALENLKKDYPVVRAFQQDGDWRTIHIVPNL